MDSMLQAVGDHLGYLIAGLCFLVYVVIKSITTIVTTNAREKSRREIAAYIAEGSITPEHGERLLRADVSNRGPHQT